MKPTIFLQIQNSQSQIFMKFGMLGELIKLKLTETRLALTSFIDLEL